MRCTLGMAPLFVLCSLGIHADVESCPSVEGGF